MVVCARKGRQGFVRYPVQLRRASAIHAGADRHSQKSEGEAQACPLGPACCSRDSLGFGPDSAGQQGGCQGLCLVLPVSQGRHGRAQALLSVVIMGMQCDNLHLAERPLILRWQDLAAFRRIQGPNLHCNLSVSKEREQRANKVVAWHGLLFE